MSKKLNRDDNNGLAITGTFTRDQIELIKRTVARDATDDELKLFTLVCKKTGLDPFSRQIYFVKRNSKRGPVVSVQAGIDGYRAVAERTGAYAGSDDPVFEGDKIPVSATVTVYKFVQGTKCAFSATARWEEYSPENIESDGSFMWRKMPFLMLSKCAEALALRKAFPSDLSGVYIKEELDQAGEELKAKPEIRMPEGLPETQKGHKNDREAALDEEEASLPLPNQSRASLQAIDPPWQRVETKIKDFESRSGTNKAGKPYTKFTVFDSQENKYITFSELDGKFLVDCGENTKIRIYYSENKWGRNIEKLEPLS